MATFFLFILIIFFIIFLLGSAILRSIVQIFIKRSSPNNSGYTKGYQNRDKETSNNNTEEHKKVFSKDEGEYVDYEEVK